MPTSASYDYYYTLLGPPDGSTTYPPSNTATITLEDTLDGSIDGTTAVGDDILFNGFGTASLHGFSSLDDPVILYSGTYYVLSQDPNLTGNIGFHTSGSYAYCFAAGTGIAVPGGEVAVETLRPGDRVLCADGQQATVRWLGRQTRTRLFHGHLAGLVRIRAGALGPAVPQRDLVVTADHGIYHSGFLINAACLVNDQDIAWMPERDLPERYCVYHVEVGSHRMLLANGAGAESFLAASGITGFDNSDEFETDSDATPAPLAMDLVRISAPRLVPSRVREVLGIPVGGVARLAG